MVDVVEIDHLEAVVHILLLAFRAFDYVRARL